MKQLYSLFDGEMNYLGYLIQCSDNGQRTPFKSTLKDIDLRSLLDVLRYQDKYIREQYLDLIVDEIMSRKVKTKYKTKTIDTCKVCGCNEFLCGHNKR